MTNLNDLKSMILSKAEELGWKTVCEAQNEIEYIEFSQYSPAGEDFSFSIFYETPENIVDRIDDYICNFDPEEHVFQLLSAKRSGVLGVPSMDILIKDAYKIEDMIFKLSNSLYDIYEEWIKK